MPQCFTGENWSAGGRREEFTGSYQQNQASGTVGLGALPPIGSSAGASLPYRQTNNSQEIVRGLYRSGHRVYINITNITNITNQTVAKEQKYPSGTPCRKRMHYPHICMRGKYRDQTDRLEEHKIQDDGVPDLRGSRNRAVQPLLSLSRS